jgi:maleylacetate reductase
MQPLNFIHQSRPGRVVFGAGSLAHLEREVEALGAKRALVLCTPQQTELAESIVARLAQTAVGIYDKATMHVPIEVARDAIRVARELQADCAIAAGGGSTMGLAKAIALESDLSILAIPTTYAGSEMTPIYGLTDNGIKKTGTDLRVLPRTVIYDPELTLTLPAAIAVTSSLNALAHAAEGLYARDASPITNLMAEEAIAALGSGLRGIHAGADELTARSQLLYGAWLAGSVLGTVGMALHHKLCHTLGGSFNLPHAETHAIVLPHALAYNAAAAPEAMQRIARALGADDAPLAVHRLAAEAGAPLALKDIGMQQADLDRAADIAASNPYWNPRPIERTALRALLQNAFDGAAPSA